MTAEEGEYSSIRVFRRLAGYMARRPLVLLGSIILIVLMAAMSSVVPALVRLAIDHGVAPGNWVDAVFYGLLIIAATGIGGLASFIGRYLLAKLAQDTVYDLRVEAFRALMRQPLAYYNRVMTGQLISRITNDTERITRFLSFRFRMLVYSIFLIGISIYYMYTMSTILTLIALIAILATVIINFFYARKVRPVYDMVRQQTGALASLATGALAGVKTVKGLALEPVVMDRFQLENEEYYNTNLQAAKLTAIYGDSSILVLAVAMAGILYFGGLGILRGLVTIGVLTAFLAYMLTLRWPLNILGFIIGDIQRAVAAAKRIFEVIDHSPDSLDPPDAVNLKEFVGDISVEDIHFSYQPGKPVLRGVSLNIRQGEKVLIVGPPGSGKSTLLRLIDRLYEPDKGKILIDGVDVRRLSSKTLRRAVAYVPQEPFIFNRSIRENIALGKPDATMEEIVRAAQIAKIHEVVEKLPMGYETLVGERGITLSGGQRQRIALARALVGDPKIILLDDPVSNLDAETEDALIQDLGKILEGRTALIVSQRPSLARLADRIVVILDGRVVEEGTHDELIARHGVYYKLYVSWVKGGDGEGVDSHTDP